MTCTDTRIEGDGCVPDSLLEPNVRAVSKQGVAIVAPPGIQCRPLAERVIGTDVEADDPVTSTTRTYPRCPPCLLEARLATMNGAYTTKNIAKPITSVVRMYHGHGAKKNGVIVPAGGWDRYR